MLVRRYGLDAGNPATLAELSRELGLPKERIRDLQKSTERVLKAVGSGAESFGAVT